MRFGAITLFILLTTAAIAHAQLADPPSFSVGDTWKLSDGRELKVMRVDDQGTAIAGLRGDCRTCLTLFDKTYTPLSMIDAGGKPMDVMSLRGVVFVGPGWKFYEWPLEVKKTWNVSAKAFTRGETQNVTIRITVIAYEDVKTKAGTFKAYKLQRDWTMSWPGYTGSSWTTTDWYAPEVRSLVKSVTTSPGGRDWELVAYALK